MTRIVSIFVLSVSLLVACSKSNDVQPASNNQSIILNDSSSTTGKLTVMLRDTTGASIANADVYIYQTYQDMQNNLFIANVASANNGLANFGYVNYGTYYLKASINRFNKTIQAIDVVQVQAQKTVLRNIYLK